MKYQADLSDAFDHPDPEQGQKLFMQRMTPDLHLHISRAVNHHLGSGENPGKYQESNPFADQEESEEGEKEREDAIDNISQSGTPVIPGTSKPSVPMGPSVL